MLKITGEQIRSMEVKLDSVDKITAITVKNTVKSIVDNKELSNYDTENPLSIQQNTKFKCMFLLKIRVLFLR